MRIPKQGNSSIHFTRYTQFDPQSYFLARIRAIRQLKAFSHVIMKTNPTENPS
jgi:hypothetical protein